MIATLIGCGVVLFAGERHAVRHRRVVFPCCRRARARPFVSHKSLSPAVALAKLSLTVNDIVPAFSDALALSMLSVGTPVSTTVTVTVIRLYRPVVPAADGMCLIVTGGSEFESMSSVLRSRSLFSGYASCSS